MTEKQVSNFNFTSQICTTKEQSERLLALGLKKETADMGWVKLLNGDGYVMAIAEDYSFIDIPAWSLHRLIILSGMCIIESSVDNFYDKVIHYIEFLIKCGDFNKEYLE